MDLQAKITEIEADMQDCLNSAASNNGRVNAIILRIKDDPELTMSAEFNLSLVHVFQALATTQRFAGQAITHNAPTEFMQYMVDTFEIQLSTWKAAQETIAKINARNAVFASPPEADKETETEDIWPDDITIH